MFMSNPFPAFSAEQTNRCDSGSEIWFYFSKVHFLAENSMGFTKSFYKGQ